MQPGRPATQGLSPDEIEALAAMSPAERADTLAGVAARLADGGDLCEPIVLLLEAHRLAPGSRSIAYDVALALREAGDLEWAASILARLARQPGAEADVLSAYGTTLKRQGRLALAISWFRRALVVDPDHATTGAGILAPPGRAPEPLSLLSGCQRVAEPFVCR